MKEFKDLIRDRRIELGKSLDDIAKVVGVSHTTILRWENGEIRDIKRAKLVALADALETEPAYLMGWQEDPTPSVSTKKKQLNKMVDEMTEDEAATALAVLRALKQKE